MKKQHFVLQFKDISVADANHYAEDLRQCLLDADPEIQVEQQTQDKNNMDFGATLVLVLGAPATVAAAHAIQKWVSRNNSASIELTTKDGTLIAKNLESKDVAEVARALKGIRQ